ncbi:profilin [Streptomyces sp. NPDC054901]
MDLPWNNYCEETVAGHTSIEDLAIAGLDGELWGTSDTQRLAPTQGEVETLISIANGSHVDRFTIQGAEWVYLRSQDDCFYGRKHADNIVVHKATESISLGRGKGDHYDISQTLQDLSVQRST